MPQDSFLRFVTSSTHPPYGNRSGIFVIAYDLVRERRLPAQEHDELEQLLNWFRENLVVPDNFSVSKHARAKNTAISWVRSSASEHVARLRKVVALVQAADFPVEELRTVRPGYVVYEDEHQVVALPFADTPS